MRGCPLCCCSCRKRVAKQTEEVTDRIFIVRLFPLHTLHHKQLHDPTTFEFLQPSTRYNGTFATFHAHWKSVAASGTGLQTLQGRNQLWPIADSSNVEISDETCGNSSISKSLLASNGGVLHYVDQLFVPPGAICPDVIFAAEQRCYTNTVLVK